MDELRNKRIHWDHSFCLQLAERHVDRPTIRAHLAEAIISEVGTLSDAYAGMAQQQEDIGRQIVTAEQLLLD